MHEAGARVLIAAKGLSAAKTRLAAAMTTQQRGALVVAMLADTIAAALRCAAVSEVYVVTNDPVVADAARRAGARLIADPTRTLNAALNHAATLLGNDRTLAALQADLPALRAAELQAALTTADRQRAAVVDAHGTGTTLLLSPPGAPLDPRFGVASAQAHADSGAALLAGRWPGLRTDVDTVSDVALAIRLGVGPATAAVVASLGSPATVHQYDNGQVRLRGDDGSVHHAGPGAVALGGWHQLRPGQRVRVHRDPAGAVYLLTLPVSAPPG